MPIFAPPYAGPKEVSYLFIDGGSLRGKIQGISNRYFGGKQFSIHFPAFFNFGRYTKVFYYDALPVREERETEDEYNQRIAPQKNLLDAAAGVDRVHVYEGDARRRRRRGLEQKKVDVMITVDMLTHTFRRNMHQATLLTGDNDFKPLIDALVSEGMFVTLWYPTGETSKELYQAADARKPLNMVTLRQLLTESSQRDFSIPVTVNVPPEHETPGTLLEEGEHNGKRHTISRDGNDYLITWEHDSLNVMHMRHSNLDLLREYSFETQDVRLPAI